MPPDSFQEAWQSQSSQTRVMIAADLLLNEVQRNQEDFQATILGRDIREVAVSLLMIPLWFFLGAMWSLPWSWYLTVPALIWIAGFILVDRMRQCQRQVATGEPLVASVRESLAQVEHQIWLLRNIVWWYLLPPTIALLSFFVHATWKSSRDWSASVPPMLIIVGVYAFIYFVNQLTVRTQLEPRRQELLKLLAGLKDETSEPDIAIDYERTNHMKTSVCKKTPTNLWSTLSFVALLAAATTAASFAAHYAGKKGADYPKLSPFTAIRWDNEQPEVEVNGEWFKLVSINDVSTDEMLAFSKSTFGRKWQKRFEEDLVELLTLMGHTPEKTVTLVVQLLTSPEQRTLENVLMTEENRWAIWDAAQAREKNTGADYPKLSPFTAIRWDGEQPEVEVNGQWFKLVSINDVSTDEMLAFSKSTFGRKWQKRFEEDLVELLTRMGRPPQDTVQLVIQALSHPLDTRTLNKVPMTSANRQAIWDAAQAREANAK